MKDKKIYEMIYKDVDKSKKTLEFQSKNKTEAKKDAKKWLAKKKPKGTKFISVSEIKID